MSSSFNKPYLETSRNDPFHVQYLNVAESTLLFSNNNNNTLGMSHGFNSECFNHSLSANTAESNDPNNLYLQISRGTRSEGLNNSTNSSKIFEKFYEKELNNHNMQHTSTHTPNSHNGSNNLHPNHQNNYNNHNYFNDDSDSNYNENESILNSASTKSAGSTDSSTKRKMPTKINFLHNHHARMRKLEKLITKNIILTPIAIIFSIIIAIILFISIFTDYYEYSYYDVNGLSKKILFENNQTLHNIEKRFFENNQSLFKRHHGSKSSAADINDLVSQFIELALNTTREAASPISTDISSNNNNTSSTKFIGLPIKMKIFNKTIDNLTHILFDNKTYTFYKLISSNFTTTDTAATADYNASTMAANQYSVLTRVKVSFFNELSIKHYHAFTTYSGLFQTCNFLSELSRKALNITKCIGFYTEHVEMDEYGSNPYVLGQKLIRVQNTAACCSILSLILITWSIITGFLSMLRKSVPLTMATGVLHLLLSTFVIFLLTVMHIKIYEESKHSDCYDLRKLINHICAIRTIKIGSSLAITWIAFPLCIITSTLWLYLTKIQKVLVHLNGSLH